VQLLHPLCLIHPAQEHHELQQPEKIKGILLQLNICVNTIPKPLDHFQSKSYQVLALYTKLFMEDYT